MKKPGSCIWLASTALCVALGVWLLPPSAHAQIPGGPPTCKQLWEEANQLAAKDAREKARLASGAVPGPGVNQWMDAWMRAWMGVWAAGSAALKPGPGSDCCDINWFELAAQTGKAAWAKAWQTAPPLSSANQAWAQEYAKVFVEEWAKEWFVHYPWLCARARAKASAQAFANASAYADATANAWAWAWANTDTWARVRAAVWTEVWSKAGSAAWARAGAEAMATALAGAESAALARVSGNCALAAASACARAAAAAFAAAWAAAGSSAYSSAYAAASAQAMAQALAEAWASAVSSANAQAFAAAFADAFAKAGASAFAAVWRQRLASEGQVAQIVKWWTTPGAAPPGLQTIRKLLAAAQANASKKAWDTAWDIAWNTAADFRADFDKARSYVYRYVYAWSYSWVESWTESWAYAWAQAWAETYALACSGAAAEACAKCPPCTTTTTGTRPRTVTQPSGFTYTLTGMGVTAGTIFVASVQNTSTEPIVVEIPAGTVFKPSDPKYQTMITAENQTLNVPPNQTTQAPLQGYCLEYGKQPPPATTLGALGKEPVLLAVLDSAALSGSLAPQAADVKYQVDDNPTAYAAFLRIIQAGNRLAAEGSLHKDLPSDKQKLAVIQRALWTYGTRNTSMPHTRDTLLNDIRRQVKDSRGTQSDADIQELVNHLIEDVEAVLRTAGVT